MDTLYENEINRAGNRLATDVSGAAVLFDRFADRGVVSSVRRGVKEQMEREAKTRALDPQAYRLSQMPEGTLDAIYRRGKENMSSEDVLRYFGENRRQHLQNADFEGNTGIDVCENNALGEKSLVHAHVLKSKSLRELPQGVKKRVVKTTKRLMTQSPKWIDFSRAEKDTKGRRFPISALAAIIAIAMSLFLIVASSVMVTRAESEISSLKKEIDDTSAEIAKLRSDFEVQNDLLEIRRIAVEEYGMVSEEFVKMQYMEGTSEDSVESFEEETRQNVSLDAILSAIGLK